MRAIDINLSSDPYRNDAPMAALLVVLALVAGGFTGWNAYSHWSGLSLRAAQDDAQAGQYDRVQKMNAELSRLRAELGRVDEPTLMTQAVFVSGILQQRNFSWTRLFDALERVTPWHSRLVSVRPVFEHGAVEVVLDGVSQDTDAFLALQDAFLHAPQFTRVQPGDFQKMPADQRIFFNLRVTFLPGAPLPDEPGAGAEGEAVAEAAGEPAPDEAGPPAAAASSRPAGPPNPAAPARAGVAPPAPARAAPDGSPAAEPAEARAATPSNQVTSRPGEPVEARPVEEGAGVPPSGASMTPADRRSLLKVNPNQPSQAPRNPRRPPGGEPPPEGERK